MSEWKEKSLSEIADVLTGFPFKGDEYDSEGKLKVVRGENVTVFSLRWDIIKFWNKSTEGLEKYFLKENDIVIGMDGSKVGENRSFIRKQELPLILAQRITRLRAKSGNDQIYLGYCILNNAFLSYVKKVQTGTSIPHISQSQIADFKVSVPNSLHEQQSIAAILSSLDNKIDLLRRQNQTLEQLAQTIFKQWFVHFQYPGATGKMETTELGNVPKGWRVSPISKIISVQNGYAFKSEDFKEKGDVGILKIRNISNQIVDINRTDFVSNDIANGIDKKFKASSGSMLIAMTGAEVAKIGIVTNTSKELMINQRVGMFIDKVDFGKLFCYLLLTQESYQKVLRDKGSGSSAQPNISASDIESVEFVIPSNDILLQFGEIVNPLFKKLCQSLDEIQTLTQLRDSLLPRLMSGRLRVG